MRQAEKNTEQSWSKKAYGLYRKYNINLMYLPALILFGIFVVYVFADGVRISFTNWNGYSQTYRYIGLDNYKRLFSSKIVRVAFANTLIYGIGGTILLNALGMFYAILLNKKLKGRNIVRAIIYIPTLIAPLIMGYIIYFIFQYDRGALNDVLIFLGANPVDWLAKPQIAIMIITLMNVFQFCGIAMIIYIAGLQGIPKMYYEAAQLDGATKAMMFKNVTLPLLMPALKSSILLNLIGGLKIFGPVVALTGGGPGYTTHSLSSITANAYFSMQHAGFSATIGIFTFAFILVVTLVGNFMLDKRRVEY